MRTRFIYICSPCRGDMEKNITKAQSYCREAVELFPDVVPIAPHVYCTQFMDDTNPKERALGNGAGDLTAEHVLRDLGVRYRQSK